MCLGIPMQVIEIDGFVTMDTLGLTMRREAIDFDDLHGNT